MQSALQNEQAAPNTLVILPMTMVSIVVMVKIEQVEQIADRRAIHRHIRVLGIRNWVSKIVAAPVS